MYYRDLNGGFVKRSQYRKEKWNAQSLFEYIERLKSRGKMKKFTATLEGTMPEIVEFHTLNGSVLGSGTFHCQGGLLSFLVRPETFETMSIKDRQDAIPIVTAYFSIEPTGDMVDVFLMDVTPI
jgi:hypothetical protein